jgi:Bacterial Ig domain
VRRAAILASIAGLLIVGAAPAGAYWRSGGSGGGQAPVDTLPAADQPSASASVDTVTVQWPQTTFRGSALGGYGAGGYILRRYPATGGAAVTPNGGCGTTISGAAGTLSCQETGVPTGSWTYTVTPVLGSWTGGESPSSASVTVALGAPVMTSVSAQGPPAGQTTGPIQLDWNASVGATGYNVYRRTSSGSYDFTAPLNGAAPVTATSYTDSGSGLTGNTEYAYVVRAVRLAVESAGSNELSATAIARPAAPTGVTASLAPNGRIDVAWSTVAGAAGYNIYRRISTGSYDYSTPLNGVTPATATSFTDTGTTDGTSYRYVVRAVASGASALESFDSAETAAATADATPPASATVADPGSPLGGSVTLSGAATDPGSGIASIRFQYARSGTSTWTTACTATTAPYSCIWGTTAVADGLYDLRALAVDGAGNTTASSIIANRRVDNTGPTVTLADPGAFVRATVTLTANATDSDTGVVSVRIQRAASGTTAWTDVCTALSAPYSCSLNTALLSDGGYDLRAIATDSVGNTTTSAVVANRVVDNTAPSGTDIQTTNAPGGIAAKPETGDVITFTFSEPLAPASILAGWTGAPTPVVVRITNGNPDLIMVFDATNTTQLALGSVRSGKKYVTATTTFSGSSIALSGNTISVTLGTPSGPTSTANGSTTLQWTTATAATDRAGNPLTAATIAETGTADLDF